MCPSCSWMRMPSDAILRNWKDKVDAHLRGERDWLFETSESFVHPKLNNFWEWLKRQTERKKLPCLQVLSLLHLNDKRVKRRREWEEWDEGVIMMMWIREWQVEEAKADGRRGALERDDAGGEGERRREEFLRYEHTGLFGQEESREKEKNLYPHKEGRKKQVKNWRGFFIKVHLLVASLSDARFALWNKVCVPFQSLECF